MIDSTKHQGLRRQMVEKLKKKGIDDSRVLEAITNTPRHWFMDTGLESHAYEDKAYPIAAEQTISQPYTVAFQSQLLQLPSGAKVLEIGTGSGYQTAILLALGFQVYTVERQRELFKKTQRLFRRIDLRPKKQVFGDGYKGLSEAAPFDGILVTAGAPEVPTSLLTQLNVGGKLIIPVGREEQIMTQLIRKGDKEFDRVTFGSFKFVPLLENKN